MRARAEGGPERRVEVSLPVPVFPDVNFRCSVSPGCPGQGQSARGVAREYARHGGGTAFSAVCQQGHAASNLCAGRPNDSDEPANRRRPLSDRIVRN